MNKVEQSEIKRQLEKLIRRYCLFESGRWISDFEWVKIPVEFSESKEVNKWNRTSGKIVLTEQHSAEAIFPEYIKELRYKWLWWHHPIKYLLNFVCRCLFKKDMSKQKQLAEKWLKAESEIF